MIGWLVRLLLILLAEILAGLSAVLAVPGLALARLAHRLDPRSETLPAPGSKGSPAQDTTKAPPC